MNREHSRNLCNLYTDFWDQQPSTADLDNILTDVANQSGGCHGQSVTFAASAVVLQSQHYKRLKGRYICQL